MSGGNVWVYLAKNIFKKQIYCFSDHEKVNRIKKLKNDVLMYICCYLVTKSCLTLCDPVDCSPPGFSIHGISQARILEWIASSFWDLPGDLPNPGIEPVAPALAGRFLYCWATREAPMVLKNKWKQARKKWWGLISESFLWLS